MDGTDAIKCKMGSENGPSPSTNVKEIPGILGESTAGATAPRKLTRHKADGINHHLKCSSHTLSQPIRYRLLATSRLLRKNSRTCISVSIPLSHAARVSTPQIRAIFYASISRQRQNARTYDRTHRRSSPSYSQECLHRHSFAQDQLCRASPRKAAPGNNRPHGTSS